MRTTLGIVLIVIGILTSIMVPSNKTAAITGAKGDPHRRAVVHGLHIARPVDMKTFPVEVVALPWSDCCDPHTGRDAKLIDWLDELTAECPKKIAHNMNDPCGAKCPQLSKVLWRVGGKHAARETVIHLYWANHLPALRGQAYLMRRTLHPTIKGAIWTFECKDCGKQTEKSKLHSTE